ncbi:Crp-like helix-turn-helix domain-containing protein [Formivibrio citricus]|uniref:Crp-like helix-turn-helix domain-containing protein n=1 Tax=Formivibrio citricus TaxID=83765 RepID=A0A1I5BJ75_9NEIS|nr:Crp/Fnr family transcriptional regulator [Formivibrio citricus]SFN74795.1 Crp-like helix-turn-helix domain-containing protein [Formivibrio citricus]
MKKMLAEIPLFEGFSEEQLDQLIRVGIRRKLPKGTYLFREGEVADAMYVLLDGRTRSLTSDNLGKEFVFKIGEPGDIFGEISLIDGEPRGWTTQVDEDAEVLMISRQDFLRLLMETPEMKDLVIKNLARIVRRLQHTMKSLALLDVYGRVRALFESMATVIDGQEMIEQPLTQQAIADRVGSSREMIARILKELVFGGYIKLENKKIIILQKLPIRY